jgi:hypothetical protein
MRQISELVAVIASALFTGAAVYISLVEHPARMECGAELAGTVFPPSYRRATVMQVSLVALGFLASAAAWLGGGIFWWAIGGLTLLSVVPYTLIFILPVNHQLLDTASDRPLSETQRLLTRWGYLHAVRCVQSGAALLVFLYLLIFVS